MRILARSSAPGWTGQADAPVFPGISLVSYQPPLKPTLGRMVPVMPAQAGIHDFGRIDPQPVDGRDKPGHDGKRTPMRHSQGPLVSV